MRKEIIIFLDLSRNRAIHYNIVISQFLVNYIDPLRSDNLFLNSLLPPNYVTKIDIHNQSKIFS